MCKPSRFSLGSEKGRLSSRGYSRASPLFHPRPESSDMSSQGETSFLLTPEENDIVNTVIGHRRQVPDQRDGVAWDSRVPNLFLFILLPLSPPPPAPSLSPLLYPVLFSLDRARRRPWCSCTRRTPTAIAGPSSAQEWSASSRTTSRSLTTSA